MADNQTLAVLQEILLKSRIKFVTGTEAEWTAANPVLLDGEYGLIRGSSPLKYKVGDGTKTWSALGWGNVTSLAQLTADATHRLVTDTEKTKWNDKAEVFTFNYNAYLHPPTEGLNPQGQVAKNIVAAINANKKCVVVAQNVTVQEIEDSVSGFVSITEVSASAVTGLIDTIRMASDDSGRTVFLATASITFKSDGTVTTAAVPYTGRIVMEDALPEYSTEKAPTVSGFAATYYLTRNGSQPYRRADQHPARSGAARIIHQDRGDGQFALLRGQGRRQVHRVPLPEQQHPAVPARAGSRRCLHGRRPVYPSDGVERNQAQLLRAVVETGGRLEEVIRQLLRPEGCRRGSGKSGHRRVQGEYVRHSVYHPRNELTLWQLLKR